MQVDQGARLLGDSLEVLLEGLAAAIDTLHLGHGDLGVVDTAAAALSADLAADLRGALAEWRSLSAPRRDSAAALLANALDTMSLREIIDPPTDAMALRAAAPNAAPNQDPFAQCINTRYLVDDTDEGVEALSWDRLELVLAGIAAIPVSGGTSAAVVVATAARVAAALVAAKVTAQLANLYATLRSHVPRPRSMGGSVFLHFEPATGSVGHEQDPTARAYMMPLLALGIGGEPLLFGAVKGIGGAVAKKWLRWAERLKLRSEWIQKMEQRITTFAIDKILGTLRGRIERILRLGAPYTLRTWTVPIEASLLAIAPTSGEGWRLQTLPSPPSTTGLRFTVDALVPNPLDLTFVPQYTGTIPPEVEMCRPHPVKPAQERGENAFRIETSAKRVTASVGSLTIASPANTSTFEAGITVHNPFGTKVVATVANLGPFVTPGFAAEIANATVTLAPYQTITASDPSAPRLRMNVSAGLPAVRLGVALGVDANGKRHSCSVADVRITSTGTVVKENAFTVHFGGATPSTNSTASATVNLNGTASTVSWKGRNTADLSVQLRPGPNTVVIVLSSGTGLGGYIVPPPFGSGRAVSFSYNPHVLRYFLQTFNPASSPADFYVKQAERICAQSS
ncbi:MAG: hypothetical protein IPK85_05630 [Gemmatimonadetes bacterium]|nr:hypothetical protein [Gemmatimonadota bacterium]